MKKDLKRKKMDKEKDLEYWRNNAEEDYITTPISVLRYITELENEIKQNKDNYLELLIGFILGFLVMQLILHTLII